MSNVSFISKETKKWYLILVPEAFVELKKRLSKRLESTTDL